MDTQCKHVKERFVPSVSIITHKVLADVRKRTPTACAASQHISPVPAQSLVEVFARWTCDLSRCFLMYTQNECLLQCVSLGEYSFVGTDGARHFCKMDCLEIQTCHLPSLLFPNIWGWWAPRKLFFFIGWYLYEISSQQLLTNHSKVWDVQHRCKQHHAVKPTEKTTREVNEPKKIVRCSSPCVFGRFCWRSVGWWMWWCYCCYCVKRLTVLQKTSDGWFSTSNLNHGSLCLDELCLSDWWSNLLSF